MKEFEIFNVNSPLLEKNPLIFGKTPIDAVKNYLLENKIKGTPKKSGSNYVSISAREVIQRNDKKYYKGNTNWYEIIN